MLGSRAVELEASAPGVVVEGETALVGERTLAENVEKLRALFRVLEEKQRLMGLLEKTVNAGELTLFIGDETGLEGAEGVALIAVTGGLPKPVRVGQVVDGDLKLIEVNRRDVGLGASGSVTLRLSLAPGAPGADGLPAPAPQMVPGGAMAPPPNFNNMPPQPGAPGQENYVPPTAVTGSLPQQPPGDGGANPVK